MSSDNKPEVGMDFSKFMEATLKEEEARQSKILPNQGTQQSEPYNANREYQKRYSHRIADRMWIGPKRY